MHSHISIAISLSPSAVSGYETIFGFCLCVLCLWQPGRVAQSVGHLTRKFDTRSGHILSFLLLLIQEGQLSVSGKNMCTKYWLTA